MAFLAPDSTVLWPEFWATLSWSFQGIQQASVFLSSFDPTSFHQHSIFCNENITTNKISDQHVELNAKWQVMPKYIPTCECHAHPGLLGNGHADLVCQNKQISCSQGSEKQENWSRRFPGLKIAQKLEYLRYSSSQVLPKVQWGRKGFKIPLVPHISHRWVKKRSSLENSCVKQQERHKSMCTSTHCISEVIFLVVCQRYNHISSLSKTFTKAPSGTTWPWGSTLKQSIT